MWEWLSTPVKLYLKAPIWVWLIILWVVVEMVACGLTPCPPCDEMVIALGEQTQGEE